MTELDGTKAGGSGTNLPTSSSRISVASNAPPSAKDPSKKTPSLLIVVVLTASLYLAKEVLIPLTLAVLVSFLFAPLVRWLARHGVDRRLSVPAVVLLVAFLLAAGATLISNQLLTLLEELPQYADAIRNKLSILSGDSRLVETFSRMDDLLAFLPSKAGSAGPEPVPVAIVETSQDHLAFLRTVLAPVLAPLATLGLVLVFAFFMLLKWDDLRDRVLRLTGQGHINVTTQALEEASARVSRYLQTQVLINTLVGLIIGVGLWVLNVPNAALWGIVVGMMRFVPYVGPWLAAGGPFLVILATTEGFQTLLAAGGLFVVVEILAVNLLEPWLYGLRTGLSAIGVLVSFVFWGWLWGPVGLLLATPLSVCLLVAAHYIPQLETVEVLLSDQRPLTSSEHLYQRLLALDPEEGEQIVEQELKQARSLADLYDGLLVPVLEMAERDRHSESLSDERSRAVYSSLHSFVGPAPKSEERGEQHMVLCLAADDLADYLTACMAVRLLVNDEVAAESLPNTLDASELVERVAISRPAAIVISAVPPMAAVYAQEKCRALCDLFPEVPIVVALWRTDAPPPGTLQRLKDAGACSVIFHFVELLPVVRQYLTNGASAVSQRGSSGRAGSPTGSALTAAYATRPGK